jgi:streptogramin lyase
MSRLMLATPAVFAVAGAVLDRLDLLAGRGFGRGGAAVARAAGVLLLGGAALWNLEVFFVRYPTLLPVNTLTLAAQAAAGAGDEYKAYFVGSEHLHAGAPTVRFLARKVAREELAPDAIPVQELVIRGGLFLVEADLTDALARLQAAYPGGELRQHRSPHDELLFSTYRVERDELARAVGADAYWRQPALRFGWAGRQLGELADAHALVVDRGGRIYVADTGNRRIDVFDAGGRPLRALGGDDRSDASVGHVWALALERDGNLLALTRDARSIMRLGASGEPVARLGGPDLFDDPAGIAAAPDGSVVVLDAGRPALVRLSPAGDVIARAGESGSGPGQLSAPAAVAVAADGRIYVADQGNGRVQRFSPALEYELAWSVPQSEPSAGQSLAVAAADGGAVYMADPERQRVLRFSGDGAKEWNIGGKGEPPDHLAWPVAVTVDEAGRVYVLDAERSSIYRFDVGGRS